MAWPVACIRRILRLEIPIAHILPRFWTPFWRNVDRAEKEKKKTGPDRNPFRVSTYSKQIVKLFPCSYGVCEAYGRPLNSELLLLTTVALQTTGTYIELSINSQYNFTSSPSPSHSFSSSPHSSFFKKKKKSKDNKATGIFSCLFPVGVLIPLYNG
jgi:hypothetical protein